VWFDLAGSIVKVNVRYPWPYDFARDAGLNDEALRRLESIGWLRRGRRGDVEIWHDRLLNWAVAEWLIDQRCTNQIAQSDLAELLCRMYQNQPTLAGKRLGYVSMDYLWLACDPENAVQQDVSILLQALEEHPSYGGDPEAFYTALVPTLGERIYPALRERLKASVSQTDEHHFISRFVGQAVAKIGERASESASEQQVCTSSKISPPPKPLMPSGRSIGNIFGLYPTLQILNLTYSTSSASRLCKLVCSSCHSGLSRRSRMLTPRWTQCLS